MFAAMGAAAVLDADELLWTRGAKLISVPNLLVSPRASREELTEGEKYLCEAMGISKLGFVMRRAEMHRDNYGWPAGYFRADQSIRGGSVTVQGAAAGGAVDFVRELFPREFSLR